MNSAPNSQSPPAQGFGYVSSSPHGQFPQNIQYMSKQSTQSMPPPYYQQGISQGPNHQQQSNPYTHRQPSTFIPTLANGNQEMMQGHGNFPGSPGQMNNYTQSSNPFGAYSQSPFAATSSPSSSSVNTAEQSFQMTANATKAALDIFSMVGGTKSQLVNGQSKALWSWAHWPLLALKPYFQVSHWYVVSKIALVLFPFAKEVGLYFSLILRIGCGERVPLILQQGCLQCLAFLAQFPFSSTLKLAFILRLLVFLLHLQEMTLVVPIYIFPVCLFIELIVIVHAFITYVILVSIVYGIDGKFTPDILGITSSSALVTSMLELFVVRAGFFILGLGSSVPILEYLAYVGYKYVGLVLIVAGGLLAPGANGIITRFLWVYVSISYAVFALRSLKDMLNLSSSLGDPIGGGLLPGGGIAGMDVSAASASGVLQRRRVYFLLLVAALQAAFSYYLIIEPQFVPAPSPFGST